MEAEIAAVMARLWTSTWVTHAHSGPAIALSTVSLTARARGVGAGRGTRARGGVGWLKMGGGARLMTFLARRPSSAVIITLHAESITRARSACGRPR